MTATADDAYTYDAVANASSSFLAAANSTAEYDIMLKMMCD